MNIKRFIAKGLRAVLQPPAITDSFCDKTSEVCSGTQMTDSTLGRYSYIGHDGFVLCADIGPFCSIADNCRIGGAEHALEYVSTSPVFHKGKNILHCNFTQAPQKHVPRITIGADVWIGANAVVLSGITIGHGAVVGAGSIVTHDIPPYEIWAGNPARKIKDRFDKDIKDSLLASEWWNWDDDRIMKYSDYFSDPESFIRLIKEDKI